MSPEMPAAFDQFVAPIGEFAQAVGLQVEPGARGAEFVFGDHSVLIMPIPASPSGWWPRFLLAHWAQGPG
jgi:hypothetical protein